MAFTLPPSAEAGDDRYQPLAVINMPPMVEARLVLLIIFMVTAPLLAVGVPPSLPKTTAAELQQPKEPIVLSLNREGGTFIGNEPVAATDLRDRLAQLAAEDPERIVYVRGDREISYAQLMDALGLVNTAGFSKVSLLAEGAKPK